MFIFYVPVAIAILIAVCLIYLVVHHEKEARWIDQATQVTHTHGVRVGDVVTAIGNPKTQGRVTEMYVDQTDRVRFKHTNGSGLYELKDWARDDNLSP